LEKDYVVSVLSDYSRLNEIYHLTHDSLVDAEYITPQVDGQVLTSPHLDRISETSIVTTEQNGQIIATISITIDNPHGLPTDNYFKEEAAAIRASSSESVGVIWRIASRKECRRNSRLIMDTVYRGAQIMHESSCRIWLFVIAEKHVRFYKRFFDAKIVSRKITTVDHKVEIPMFLMQADVERAWNTFKANTKL
jgi:hypothetical protein